MRASIAVAAIGLLFSACLASAQQGSPFSGSVEPVIAAPKTPAAVYTWLGGAISNGYGGTYTGGIASLNKNLLSDGVVLRGDLGGGNYTYNRSTFPSATIPGSVATYGGDAMVGYRKSVGAGWMTGYVGANVETHDNRDPAAVLSGTKAGVKGIVEYFGPISPSFDISGYASYSSAFSTYTAFGRVGYKLVDKVKVGPEASLFGNDAYRDGRLGGFIGLETPFGEIAISGGYRRPFTTGPDGYYANLYVGFEFR